MKAIKGIILSPGLAIGRVYVYDLPTKVNIKHCPQKEIERDLMILKKAVKELKDEYIRLATQLPGNLKDLFQALILMVEDLAGEVIEHALNNGLCIDYALLEVSNKYITELSSHPEVFALRAFDVRAVMMDLLAKLRGFVYSVQGESTILVAREFGIIDIARAIAKGVKGFISISGGITSHAAIISRSLGIPYMIIPNLNIEEIKNGVEAILDAINGEFILEPDIIKKEEYRSLEIKLGRIIGEVNEEISQPAVTKDGVKITILANVGNIEEARIITQMGGEGIGLLRLEFMYMGRDNPPNVEELYTTLSKIAEFVKGRIVTIRILDVGGDKPVKYIKFKPERNPFLGFRGIRLLLKELRSILEDEILVSLKLARNYPIKLMFPMITTLNEVFELKKIVSEIAKRNNFAEELRKIKLGVMIETPSAALIADRIAREVDFLSIGTNDLTQYTLAVDRSNEHVQYLYNELEPSVLMLIKNVVEAGKKYGVEVSVCGEMASRGYGILALISLGVRVLSANPIAIPRIKYLVRRLNYEKLRSVYDYILSASSAYEVKEVLNTKIIKPLNLEYPIKLLGE